MAPRLFAERRGYPAPLFQHLPLRPPFFLPSPCTAVLPQASTGPSFPPPASWSPQKNTTWLVRKMPRDCPLLFTNPFSSVVSWTFPAVGLHSAMTPADCLASRSPAACSRDGLRCSVLLPSPNPCGQILLPPYVSVMVDKRSVNQLTGCFTNTSASANLPPWLVLWG